MSILTVYLAGPTVFRPDARREGERLKEICRGYGMTGLFPLDMSRDLRHDGLEAARAIRIACQEMVRRADAVVADLSPFRGPHCDDGTAVEIGIALERGLPIFGYSSDLRPIACRIVHTIPPDGFFRDADGFEVENFGQPFNSMIAGALAAKPQGSASEAIAICALRLLGEEIRDQSAG